MKILNLLIFVFIINAVVAQPSNDDCDKRIKILDPISYCSGPMEFTNVGATNSGFGPATCWNMSNNDVWFEFTAYATAINIVINGTNSGSTFARSQVALYSGSCTGTISQIACRGNTGTGGNSLLQNGLIVGNKYIIRVAGEGSSTGTFQLCLNNFNPPVEPGQDCPTGAILCDKSPFVVQVLAGGGSLPDEGDKTCLEGGNPNTLTEDQSTWLRWTAKTSGSLTFKITPLNPKDDIDFAVFELTNGVLDCSSKVSLRCIATSCPGPTGLNLTSTDLEEDFNCEPGEDGFAKFIDMEAGKSYGVLINNFSNSGIGFNIEWGGTGEFAGPVADFTIDPMSGLKCDQDFIVTNMSSIDNGTITNYNWNFGERAQPPTSSAIGPHAVNYESFGEKFIVLTVKSDKGCIVTQVLPLIAEACCEDLDPLEINFDNVKNVSCPESTDGSITTTAVGGGGSEYQFGINQGEVSSDNVFDGLAAGEYEILVIDLKGCRDSSKVFIADAEPVDVDAGPDQELDLGISTTLDGSYVATGIVKAAYWTPFRGLSDSSDLKAMALPQGTTTYTLNVETEGGCIYKDDMVIRVNTIRKISAPNAIIDDGANTYFNISGKPAVSVIQRLRVYDRWGNKIYEGFDLAPDDYTIGWDGTFNGQRLNAGVFVWQADVKFVDNEVISYAGDITVIR